MDTVIAKGVLATFFIRCSPQLGVPEQRLTVLLSLFVSAEYMISSKPNLCNLHNVSPFYIDSAKMGIIFDTNNFFAKQNCFW